MTFKKEADGTYQNADGVTIKSELGFQFSHLVYTYKDQSFYVDFDLGFENPTKGTDKFDPSAVDRSARFVSLELFSPFQKQTRLPYTEEEVATQFKEALLLMNPTSKVKVTLNGVEI